MSHRRAASPARARNSQADQADFTVTPRVLVLSLIAMGIGVASSYLAMALLRLIALFTNLF